MKRSELNSLARSVCRFFLTRDNDIVGFWGIGVICRVALTEPHKKLVFKILPGKPIKIFGFESTRSVEFTSKLLKFRLDSISGKMTFIKIGRFENGAEKFLCVVSVAIAHEGRVGLNTDYVTCWPHDPGMERRSTTKGFDTDFNRLQKYLC